MNIVFFDIDGTLATGTQVPASARKAIRLLRNKGDLVWICTGRPLKYAKKNFYQYANGYIVSNGRQGFTCCAKIYDKPLTKEQVQRISRTLDQIGAGYIFFEGNRGCYYGPDYGFAEMQKIWPADFLKKDVPVDTLIPYSFDVVFKDQEMKKKIEEELGDLCVLNPHGPHPSADVTVRGWDKGDGLKAVAEYMPAGAKRQLLFIIRLSHRKWHLWHTAASSAVQLKNCPMRSLLSLMISGQKA